MSWWKKAKTHLTGFGVGGLMNSLETHLHIKKNGLESALQSLEQKTGYVRDEWTQKEWQKMLVSSQWRLRMLAYGHSKFPLTEPFVSRALKDPDWGVRFAMISRPDVFLEDSQINVVLQKDEGADNLIDDVVKKRRPEWTARSESKKLKARVGLAQGEDHKRPIPSAL